MKFLQKICAYSVWLVLDHSFIMEVAQLVEQRAVTQDIVSSTPAGPTLRVLK